MTLIRRSASLVGPTCAALAVACSSAPTSIPTGEPGTAQPLEPAPVFDAAPVGWAAVADLGSNGTTGGEGGEVITVTTTAELEALEDSPGPRVILISGVIGEGRRVSIASNTTLIGLPGAEFHGGLRVDGASNVIIRNLKIVGNDCKDAANGCSSGADALSIGDGAHHVWVDHCDISDGSDGNLDVNHGADYVTVSWTKFHYSGKRAGGHQFSNLIGSSDDEPGDVGRLRVTWHHNWWAQNIDERMPRVRYGAVHIFNNLYTPTGNNYCIGVGVFANILTERNVFVGVRDPIQSSDYSNDQSVVVSRDNVYLNTTGETADLGTNVFTPPYPYTLDASSDVQRKVQAGAGVCAPPYVFSAVPVPSCNDPPEDASTG